MMEAAMMKPAAIDAGISQRRKGERREIDAPALHTRLGSRALQRMLSRWPGSR
jgi:hypothetical protein